MATERAPYPGQTERTPVTITNSDGTTVTLDDAYFQAADEARRARLASPPLTDEELARMRERHPDQAWFWTREWYDGEREADENEEAGRHGPIYDSDEDFLRSFDVDADADV